MNDKDKRLMEKYARAVFGCGANDLSDKEERMLIYYIREREPEFLNHCRCEE